ncbi:FUN14 domain-containing protein 1 isoform X2 [Photinus pyralis]|uniref:FUN14 domain-containing protein 1 n=1 Tax=Photinus pyralis TaxID=7054 RepID=A0A1Y1MJZ8_PHOPY|nr:FUN14 domain-containing protein 1 isoform X2 [Photinus pyralis]
MDSNKKVAKPINTKDTKSIIDEILGDVSKTSATKQIIIGASSGWVTGYLAMKVGRAAAFALGGGVILLELANEKGYIRINWDKINRQIDQVEDFVDRKADQVESLVKDRKKAAKRWYSNVTGIPQNKLREIHVFLISFVAGIAIGIGTS